VAQGSDSTRAPPQKNGWGQRPSPTTNQRPALSTNQDADRRVETIEGAAAGQAGNALSSIREKGVYSWLNWGGQKTKVVVAQILGKWGWAWNKKCERKNAPFVRNGPEPLTPDIGKVFTLDTERRKTKKSGKEGLFAGFAS
jgi:hypothetical protein